MRGILKQQPFSIYVQTSTSQTTRCNTVNCMYCALCSDKNVTGQRMVQTIQLVSN